jgi:ribonuclease G
MTTALLEDGRLVTLQRETRDASYAVGNLYLAKVKKLMPGLNAAFVNVGHSKDAFLHYLDLGSQFNTFSQYIQTVRANPNKRPTSISKVKNQAETNKHGTVTDLLTQGQELLVQIAKEPISTKGPRLTTEITFTGRFLVLTPFNDRISVSQKIKDHAEKTRLRRLIESMKPKNFGVIVRTSAENKKAAELNAELRLLLKAWDDAIAKVQTATPPSLVYEEESRAVGEIRDILSPEFESIQVNNAEVFEQIHDYVNLIAPDRSDIVKLYSEDTPIFDKFGITKQIKSSFGKTVSFKSGAYIIVESTEALHVIDVNSGNRSRTSTDQESNALNVNLLAADEIARQLRLRDMGGIIVIDFIDMAKAEHRNELYKHMREVMQKDRARHNILPLSKFGLMQITRQRVRPALDIATAETCPSCGGKGEVQPSLLFTDKLKDKIDYLVHTLNVNNFIMYVHPFVDAYLKKGIMSEYWKWRREFKRKFRIMPDQSLNYLEYKVLDKDRNEIDLKEEKDTSSSETSKKERRSKKHAADAEDESQQ